MMKREMGSEPGVVDEASSGVLRDPGVRDLEELQPVPGVRDLHVKRFLRETYSLGRRHNRSEYSKIKERIHLHRNKMPCLLNKNCLHVHRL